MSLSLILAFVSIGFVIGWLACALVQARWLCEKLDNANIAMKTLLDVKVQASKERAKFEPSAN